MSVTDPHAALARHLPLLRYDSLEPYYTDSAAVWTDNPGNVLRRADGTVLARAGDQLTLGFLGAQQYADGTAAQAGDAIADPAHDYVRQAAAMHARPGLGNVIYGHVATGSDGRTWLAYWFFSFYNDYNLVGSLLPAGLHEGDWEMIQLRLDPAGAEPDLAVYAEHRHAAARPWGEVERDGERPVVYVARGSHASYFSAGIHWTGAWFDHADGRHPAPEMTLEVIADGDPASGWAHWPGTWGGTQPKPGLGQDLGFDDSSPRGPGHHAQWADPIALLDTVRDAAALAAGAPTDPALQVPPQPGLSVAREGTNLRITYASSDPAVRALVVGVREADTAGPAVTYHVTVATAQGVAEVPADLAGTRAYLISMAVVTADGRSSAAAEAPLAAIV